MALNLPDDDIEDQGGLQGAVVVQRSAANTMPVAVRAKAVMSAYATVAQLQALVAGTQHITAITNAAGRDQASAARTALVRARTEINRRGKEARDDANAFAKAVIAAERELIAITAPEEERLDGLVTAWEVSREAERQAKAKAEEQRVAALRVRIEALRPNVRRHTVAALHAERTRVDAILIGNPDDRDGFAEFFDEAIATKRDALSWLAMEISEAEALEATEKAAAAARIAEDQRLAAERAELAAERERQAAERRAADEAAAKVRAAQEAAQEALRTAQLRLAEDAERVAAEGRRIAAEAEAAERRAAEREAEDAARIVAAMQDRQRAADEATAFAQRAAERRLRRMPTAAEMAAALADAFDTDVDVAEGWLKALSS